MKQRSMAWYLVGGLLTLSLSLVSVVAFGEMGQTNPNCGNLATGMSGLWSPAVSNKITRYACTGAPWLICTVNWSTRSTPTSVTLQDGGCNRNVTLNIPPRFQNLPCAAAVNATYFNNSYGTNIAPGTTYLAYRACSPQVKAAVQAAKAAAAAEAKAQAAALKLCQNDVKWNASNGCGACGGVSGQLGVPCNKSSFSPTLSFNAKTKSYNCVADVSGQYGRAQYVWTPNHMSDACLTPNKILTAAQAAAKAQAAAAADASARATTLSTCPSAVYCAESYSCTAIDSGTGPVTWGTAYPIGNVAVGSYAFSAVFFPTGSAICQYDNAEGNGAQVASLSSGAVSAGGGGWESATLCYATDPSNCPLYISPAFK